MKIILLMYICVKIRLRTFLRQHEQYGKKLHSKESKRKHYSMMTEWKKIKSWRIQIWCKKYVKKRLIGSIMGVKVIRKKEIKYDLRDTLDITE